MLGPTNSLIRSIIFATDLTENSALRCATEMASACSAKLVLVHVLPPSEANPMDYTSSDLRKQAESAKTELKRISQSLLAAKNIDGEIVVRYGNVRDVIFEVQQEYSADLVVVGSSGKKIGRGKALGSTAEAILRSMPCGVVTVGPSVDPHRLSGKLTSVLFPISFSTGSSLGALPAAVLLSSKFSANLILLHVCNPFDHHSCSVACRKQMDDVVALAKKQGGQVEAFILEGPVAERILSFGRERNVDFIVMGVRRGDLEDGTRLHGTISDVVREAPCPVLSLTQPMPCVLQI